MTTFNSEGSLPAVRRETVSVEDLGDEILLYDRKSDTAHCLSAPAAAVWRACDEGLTIEALLASGSVDEAAARRAVDEFREQGLLASEQLRIHHSGTGLSRRQAVGRLAAAAVGPLVISVAAPTAWAVSPILRTTCPSSNKKCASGFFGCKQFSQCVQGTSASDSGKRDCDDGTMNCANDGRGCCPNGTYCGGGNLCYTTQAACVSC
jgi:hypothetical protein